MTGLCAKAIQKLLCRRKIGSLSTRKQIKTSLMEKLILLRHAKTEAFSDSGSDETRSLTDRGHREAVLIAERLKAIGITPTGAIVSTARRTRQTFSEVRHVFPTLPVTFSEKLYLAEPDDIISSVSALPDTDCLLVIGHNPGLHDLALQISETSGFRNSEAAGHLRVNFPTASTAIFDAKSPEDEFSVYNFELTDYFWPKSLSGAGA